MQTTPQMLCLCIAASVSACVLKQPSVSPQPTVAQVAVNPHLIAPNCEINNPVRCDVSYVMNRNKGRINAVFISAIPRMPPFTGDSHYNIYQAADGTNTSDNKGFSSFKVHLKIAPDGALISVNKVSSSMFDATLEEDLLALIRTIKFSPGNFPVYEGDFTYNFMR